MAVSVHPSGRHWIQIGLLSFALPLEGSQREEQEILLDNQRYRKFHDVNSLLIIRRICSSPNDLLVKQGAYPDCTSYCLINEGSVADLSARVGDTITPDHFRGNFVIKVAAPYEEDTWEWVKIGDVIFKNVMPCTRCIFTTIDPETGTKNPKTEPLKTLKRFVFKN